MENKIVDLQTSEVVKDDDNFIAEASIDSVKDEVVMVYSRQRGMKHSDDGSIVFIKSKDGGLTWDYSSHVVALKQYRDWGFTSPAVKILNDGTIIVLAHTNMRLGHKQRNCPAAAGCKGAYITRSNDGGQSWSQPEPVNAWPMRHIGIWDNPVELEDGTLLVAVYGHEPSRSALLWSDDRGFSWYYYGTIAYDPAGIHLFYEPGITITPDGRLVALSRQHYEIIRCSPPGGYLFFSESDDGGASWTRFKRTGIWGYPADLVKLNDGRILSVYGHRKDPMSVKIALSEDGRTWNQSDSEILYNTPNIEKADGITFSGLDRGYRHIGYPSSTVLEDGTVLSVFHSFNKDKKQIVLLARYKIAEK